MKYGKRYGRKTYAKKRSFRRPKTYKRSSYKKKAFRKAVKRIAYSTQESKILETTTVTPTSISNTWVANTCVATYPTQGVSDGQRVGDTIQPLTYTMRQVITPDDTTGNSLRFVIIRWKPDNALDPFSIVKVMQTPAGANATQSFFVEDNKGRAKFDVLYDRWHSLESYRTVCTLIKIPMKKKFKFPLTSGNPISNMLFWMVCSDSSGATDPKISWQSRTYFKDA